MPLGTEESADPDYPRLIELMRPLREGSVTTTTRVLWVLAGLGALVQFAVLLIYSLNKFHHFDLSEDYGIVNQATYLIAHGHLNPFDTIYQDQFWRDQFSLLAWPLGALRLVARSGITLLVIQSLSLAATTFVLLLVAIRVLLRQHFSLAWRLVMLAGFGLLILTDPWLYETASFDFHFQSIAALTLLLAVIGFLRQRPWLAWIMIGLTLLAGTSEILLVIGLGLGLLLLAQRRVQGLLVVAVGLGWLAVDLILGAHQSTTFALSYGYLGQVHRQNPSLMAIIEGVLAHPGLPLHVLASRHSAIGEILGYSGVLGVLFGPATMVTLLAIGANGLQHSAAFLSLQSGGFQNFPEVVLLEMGTVLMGTWLLARSRSSPRWVRWPLGGAMGVVVVMIAALGIDVDRGIPPQWLTVPPRVAAQLQTVAIPADDEVVVSEGIVGRFADRADVFTIFARDQHFQACSSTIFVVVAARNGFEIDPPIRSGSIVRDLDNDHDASVRLRDPQVHVYELQRQPVGAFLSFSSARGVKVSRVPAFGDERCTDEDGVALS